MNYIQFSIFDFFAYFMPGSIVLIAFTISLNPNLIEVTDLAQQFSNVDIVTGIVAILISYVIGFAADSIGSWLYYKIACHWLGFPNKNSKDEISFSEKRALVKQFSPENFTFIHTWKVSKTMSHNLSFSSIILAFVFITKAFQSSGSNAISWLFLLMTSLIMSVILMHRAHIFDTWHYKDLTATVKALHLEEKALTGYQR